MSSLMVVPPPILGDDGIIMSSNNKRADGFPMGSLPGNPLIGPDNKTGAIWFLLLLLLFPSYCRQVNVQLSNNFSFARMQGDQQQEAARDGLARVELCQFQSTAAQGTTGRPQQLGRGLPGRPARPHPSHPNDSARPQRNQRSPIPRHAPRNYTQPKPQPCCRLLNHLWIRVS